MEEYLRNYNEKKNVIIERDIMDKNNCNITSLNSMDMYKSWYQIRENVNSYACHLMALGNDDTTNIVKILKSEESPLDIDQYDLTELIVVNSITLYKEKTLGNGHDLIENLPYLIRNNKEYNMIILDAIFDLSKQLHTLHVEKRMVHGDISLDNIRYKYDKSTKKLTLLLDNFHASFFCFEGSPALNIFNPVRLIPNNIDDNFFIDLFSERHVSNLNKSYISPSAYQHCGGNNGYIIPNAASDFWALLILTCDLLLRRRCINPMNGENWSISLWIKSIDKLVEDLITSNLVFSSLSGFLMERGVKEEFVIYIHILNSLISGFSKNIHSSSDIIWAKRNLNIT